MDDEQPAREAAGDDVVQDLGANLPALTIGADDRHRVRLEEALHRRGRR